MLGRLEPELALELLEQRQQMRRAEPDNLKTGLELELELEPELELELELVPLASPQLVRLYNPFFLV